MKSENNALISVIVPCFNSGKTISKTISSLKSQTWKNLEIIIVNDGSTDENTIRIINKFENIKLINQKNLGLPAARNNGAKEAKGKFLFFLDSDDWIESDSLHLMYKFQKKIKKSCYIYTQIVAEGDFNKIIKNKKYNYFEQLFFNQIPYCIFIERDLWERYGGYDEEMKLGYEDWELNIRLGSKNIFGYKLNLPLFHYNVSNEGMLISISSKNHSKIWKTIKDKNRSLYKINNLIKTWKNWRKSSSNYPLILFFIWYFIIMYLPDNLTSSFFIYLRNIKWFFVRNSFQINFKK